VDEFGLMFYGARWYDPYLNRFTSPDSIIPDNNTPLDWDRYQYTRSNPLIYTDPGGHNPLAVIFIIAICIATYLATPETAYAPEAGFISPTNVDQSSATKAYFDTAPGTGDISDIYTAATGRTLFSGEEVDLGGRIFAGAASVLPVTASGLKQAGKLFDIVPYGVSKKIPGLVGHHGVMDVWATANIPGYKRYNLQAPTILLDPAHHQATIDTFNTWRKANTGSITGAIDWSNMSPKEIQKLAYSMFDAAGVPDEVRQEYFRQFYEYLYGGSEIIE
jgi:RHS repeat-associated protein